MAFSLEAVFGVNSSGVDKGLKEVGEKTESFTDKVALKVADKLTGMRDISNAIATALGINFEKIGENLARFITGISEEAQKAMEEMVKDSDRATKALLDQLEKRRTAQQNIEKLSRDEARGQREIAENVERQKVAADAVSAAIAGTAPGLSLLDRLTGGWFSRLVSVHEQTLLIADAEKAKADLQEIAVKKDEFVAKKKEEDQKKEEERSKKIAEVAKDHYATQEKLYRLKFDELPLSDKISTYQQNIALLTREIERGKSAGKNTDELQVELLENKKLLEKAITDQTEEQNKIEQKNTEELRKQVEAEAAKLRAAQMFVSVTRVGSGYESQSTDALRGVESRLQNQLGAIGPNGMPISLATAQSDYGSFLQRTTYENELANVRRELQSRADIQAYARRYGEGAARAQYGDTATNNALRDMQSSTTRTAVATETLAEQIAALNRKLGINPVG